VKYKGGHLDNEGEKTMRRRSKKGRALHSVRGPDGRFKAVSKSSEEGQVAQEGIDGLKALASRKGWTASPEQDIYCRRSDFEREYLHPRLSQWIKVKLYDYFTYLEHFRR